MMTGESVQFLPHGAVKPLFCPHLPNAPNANHKSAFRPGPETLPSDQSRLGSHPSVRVVQSMTAPVEKIDPTQQLKRVPVARQEWLGFGNFSHHVINDFSLLSVSDATKAMKSL